MYVTQHAMLRMEDRLGDGEDMGALIDFLEGRPGLPGHVAYLVWSHPSTAETLCAIAIDGSVETVYFRRDGQDMSADWFGVTEVIDLRPDDRLEAVPEWDTGYEDVPVKGEARAKRLDSRGKMVVTNRSALMLNRLVREQSSRKRQQRRRKRGA